MGEGKAKKRVKRRKRIKKFSKNRTKDFPVVAELSNIEKHYFMFLQVGIGRAGHAGGDECGA